MAKRAMPTPQTEKPNLSIIESPGGMPPKPTNSLELGRELLSSGPNEGSPSELDVLPTPQPMAIKVYLRRSRPTTKAPRRAWRTG
jgi:hypothetical protein